MSIMTKLALILFAFTLSNCVLVEGSNDCTPPWMAESNPFLAKIKSSVLYRCPMIFGDPEKKYCCYNSDGDVACCNFQEYLVFRLICLIPIVIIVSIITSIIICISCFMCPCCIVNKHRRTGR